MPELNDSQAHALGWFAADSGFPPGAGCLYRDSLPRRLLKAYPPEEVEGWPDFRDPATFGCLVVFVRQEVRKRGHTLKIHEPIAEFLGEPWGWSIVNSVGDNVVYADEPTEVEAHLAALHYVFSELETVRG